MKFCDDCKWAQWRRASNGRLHPSRQGRCTFPIRVPALPEAFYWIGGPPRPCGGSIERKSENKDHCPYYASQGSTGNVILKLEPT